MVCLGLILDEDGQKMSKSKGNTVEPWQVLDAYGADAFRWYFFASKQPWDGYRFSAETIGEGVRLFLKQLWRRTTSTSLYAQAGARAAGGRTPRATPAGPAAISTAGRCRARPRTAELVAERLEAYDATSAGRAIAELVEELSNWYVRRSRRRFWDGDAGGVLDAAHVPADGRQAARAVLPVHRRRDLRQPRRHAARACTCATSRDGAREVGATRDAELERAMALARETVRLGLGARGKSKIKVRQPLGEAVVVADGREREAIERLVDVVREELNVKRVRFVAAADELGSYEVKANYRKLGPIFGKSMPLAADAIAALDPARVRRRARRATARQRSGSPSTGASTRSVRRRVILTMRAPEGYSVEREGAHAVALDLAIDDELRVEGLRARDRPRRAERAQERRTAGRGPDRAGARRRRRADGGGRGATATTSLARRSRSSLSSALRRAPLRLPRWTTRAHGRSTASR